MNDMQGQTASYLFQQQPGSTSRHLRSEAESKEKLGTMQDFTITSPYVYSRVDSNTFTVGYPPSARVDYIPQSGTLDLASAAHDHRLRIKKT